MGCPCRDITTWGGWLVHTMEEDEEAVELWDASTASQLLDSHVAFIMNGQLTPLAKTAHAEWEEGLSSTPLPSFKLHSESKHG